VRGGGLADGVEEDTSEVAEETQQQQQTLQTGAPTPPAMAASTTAEASPTLETATIIHEPTESANAIGTTAIATTKPHRLLSWTPLDRKIMAVALPCIANFAINPLIGAVDLFWVGRMGDALAVAGQGAANQVFNSAFWMVSFLPAVTATLVSKVYAQRDPDAVQDTVCQSLLLATLIALPFTVLLLAKPDFFLRSVLSSDAPAMAYARPYFLIRAIGFWPSLLSVTGYSAFRGALDTVTPLRISLLANLFNAILDPICMFTFNMGIKGAAAATLASEIISATIYMIWLNRHKMIARKKLLKLPSMTLLKPLLKGGAALQLRNMAINITFLMVTRATQGIDSTGVAAAAHSLAIQVFQVGGIVLLALSTVAQTLIPNELVVKTDSTTGEYTSGGVHAAQRTMTRLMEWGLLLGSCLGGLQLLLLPLIQRISPLKEVQQAALIPSYIASVLQMINGLVFIGEGAMVGCQNFFQLSLSTAVATVATTFALTILPKRYGLSGVWMSFIVFNMLRLVGVFIHQTRTGPLAARNIKREDASTYNAVKQGA
jgi:MATE family multidrug resistance protein